ncbi:MAG: TolC family protein [Lachnospirales bacterium]
MKRKILVSILALTLSLSNLTTVFADTETEPSVDLVINVQPSDYSYLTDSLEEATLSNIWDVDDAKAAQRLTKGVDEPTTFNLTIEQAMLFMLASADVDYDEQRKELEENRSDLKNAVVGLEKLPILAFIDSIDTYVQYQSLLYDVEAGIESIEYGEKLALQSYEMSLNNLAIADQVYQANLHIAEADLANEKKELERTKVQYDLDVISESSYKNAVATYDQNVIKLNSTFMDYKDFKSSIASTLDLKPTDIVNLQYELKLEPVKYTAIEYTDRFLKYAPNLEMARASRDAAEKKFNLEDNYYTEATDAAESSKDSAAESSSNIAYSIKSNTNKAYNSMITSTEALNQALLDYENAIKANEDTQLSYDLGYISQSTLDKADLGLVAAQATFTSALYDYDSAKLALDYAYLSAN